MTQWGLDTLFNPAKRHMDEEKRRLQSTREEVGDNSGGKRIDLESGKVRIHKDDEDDTDTADDTADAATSGDGADPKAARNPKGRQGRERAKPRRSDRTEDGKPSEAAIRAAKRRGRTAT